MPCPFRGKTFRFTQPDGSTIELKGWGNQHQARFETLDGYAVVPDENGFYCYAKLSDCRNYLHSSGVRAGSVDAGTLGLAKGLKVRPTAARAMALGAENRLGAPPRWKIRREKRQALRRALAMHGPAGAPLTAPPSRQAVGEFVGLCLLVQFPDVPGTVTRAQVEDFCNTPGYEGFGNNGSVYDYFLENSKGKMEYTNLVTEYYTAEHPRAYYTNPAVQFTQRARELIREALDHLKARNFDFRQLTTDEDGYVYATNIFYAGPRVNNWSQGLWPHQYHLGIPVDLGPGRKAMDYQITDIGNELTLATFCHENGHMVCDYPDLYDYGSDSAGVGDFCLMCAGGHDEKNPTHVSAYLKHESGWGEATPITAGLEATAPAGENKFFLYAKNDREYFIIENRQKKGRDETLPDAGLAIWHVDEWGSNNNEHMLPTKHYELSLEQADGKYDMENDRNNGDAGDLFGGPNATAFSDTTEPSAKWWDGTPSGLELYDIQPSGDNVTFKAKVFGEGGGDAGGSTVTGASKPNTPIPDNTPSGINDTITIDTGLIATKITVVLKITHTYRGDLRVVLLAPTGEQVVLHDRGGGGADDLDRTYDTTTTPALANLLGKNIEGDWMLYVQDLARADEGRLNHWGLRFEGTRTAIIEKGVSPGIRIPHYDPAGIESAMTIDESGNIADLSVHVDITHTFIRDLIVTLVAPDNTSVVLHNRTGGSADNIIRTYTVADEPDLNNLLNKPVNGDWKLRISDNEAQDSGKLNGWSLRIVRGWRSGTSSR